MALTKVTSIWEVKKNVKNVGVEMEERENVSGELTFPGVFISPWKYMHALGRCATKKIKGNCPVSVMALASDRR